MGLTNNNLVWQARLDTKKLSTDVGRAKSKILGIQKSMPNFNFKRMGKGFQGLSSPIKGTTKSVGGLKNITNKLKGNFSQLSSQIPGLSGGLGSLAAGFGGVAAAIGLAIKAIIKITQKNMKLETSMADLQAILGATEEEMKFYRNTAIELSKTNTQSAISISKLMKTLGSQKPEILGNEEAMRKLTESTIVLSDASKMSAENTSKYLTNALNQYGAAVSEADKFMNALAAGSQKYAADIPYLSDAIEQTGRVARDSNLSFEELVGTLEIIAPSFSEPSRAGRMYKNVLLNLQTAGKGFQSGQFDLQDALEQVQQEYSNMNDPVEKSQYLTKLFGKESITLGKVLLDNKDKINEYTNAVSGTNTAYEQAEIQNDTLEASLKKLKNSWDAFIYSFNESGNLTGFFKGVVDILRKIINNFHIIKDAYKDAFSPIGDIFKSFNQLFSILTDFGDKSLKISDIFKVLGKYIKISLSPLTIGFKIISLILKGLVAGVKVIKDWATQSKTVNNIIAWLRTAIQNIIGWVTDAFEWLEDKINSLLKKSNDLNKNTKESINNILGVDIENVRTSAKTETGQKGTGQNYMSVNKDKIERDLKDINKLMIEATKEGYEKEKALLELQYQEKQEKYRGHKKALEYIDALHKKELEKLDQKYNDKKLKDFKLQQEIDKEKFNSKKRTEKEIKQFELQQYVDYQKKRLKLEQDLTDKEKELIQIKIDNANQEILNLENNNAKKLENYKLQQEIELERVQREKKTEFELQQYKLQQFISYQKKRLELDENLTEKQKELIKERIKTAEYELEENKKNNKEREAGLQEFSKLAKSLGENIQQINSDNINSVKDFGKALYKTTQSTISNYLQQAIAIGIKNAMATSGSPIVGLVVAGLVSTSLKILFDKLTAKPPGFAEGGIINGEDYYGDKKLIRANAGEMIINRTDQLNLWKMIKSNNKSREESELINTNKLLLEQNRMIENQKNHIKVNDDVIGLSSQTSEIKDIKIK